MLTAVNDTALQHASEGLCNKHISSGCMDAEGVQTEGRAGYPAPANSPCSNMGH